MTPTRSFFAGSSGRADGVAWRRRRTVGVVTVEPSSDDKRMSLRYAGSCRRCGAQLPAGSVAVYERSSKTVRCIECSTAARAVAGSAGGSARREHERRKNDREQRVCADHPKLGGLILALTDDPQSTQAWQRGAIGEETMAQGLTDLPDTFRVLHDRRIPRSRANIDHIAIAPSGVWVIDAKRYQGKRPALHVDGGICRPRTESLRVGGRDGTKLVKGVQSQVATVAAALGLPEVPVKGVLCFVEADWPIVGGSFTVEGIHIVWPRLLIKRMTEAPTQPIDPYALFAHLAAAFPIV